MVKRFFFHAKQDLFPIVDKSEIEEFIWIGNERRFRKKKPNENGKRYVYEIVLESIEELNIAGEVSCRK